MIDDDLICGPISTEQIKLILTQEQEMIRDMARDFARQRLAPYSAEWERASIFPREALKEMGALGFLGMTVPTDVGRGERGLRRLCAGD